MKGRHNSSHSFSQQVMSQFLLLVVLMAAVFLQLVQAQLPIPLPELPIPLPALPALPALPLLPAVVVCPAGFFGLLTGCAPCPAGTSSMLGALACIACPPGTYAPGPGSVSCTFCGVGTFSSPAMDACLSSPAPVAKGKGVVKKGGKA